MRSLERRKGLTVLSLLGVLGMMTVLVVNAVPLYELFCKVTGFGGTTRRADAAPNQATAVRDRIVTIRFEANVDPNLPWRFQPVQREIRVRIGERKLAHYVAKNVGGRAITGTATFNVTPAKAGPYFNKIACFCFNDQRLEAGHTVDMPVSFFVDPAIVEDRNLDDVEVITLSYTFFKSARRADASDRTETAVRNGRSGAISKK